MTVTGLRARGSLTTQVDVAATSSEQYPLLHFRTAMCIASRVVKQADLVSALHLRDDAFTAEKQVRDCAYLRTADGP